MWGLHYYLIHICVCKLSQHLHDNLAVGEVALVKNWNRRTVFTRGLRGVTDLLLLSSPFHLSVRCTQSWILAKWKQTARSSDQTVWWMLCWVVVMITVSVTFSFLCRLCKQKPSAEQPLRGAGEREETAWLREEKTSEQDPLDRDDLFVLYGQQNKT